MATFNLVPPRDGVRRVFPLHDVPGYEECWVDMVRLPSVTASALLDQNKVILNKPAFQKLDRVSDATVIQSVKAWGGWTEDGVPLECTDENKLRLRLVMFVFPDGETKTIWARCEEMFQEEVEKERKNS